VTAPRTAEEGLSVATLSAALVRPIVDGATLRALWQRAGGPALGALELAPAPAVIVGPHRFALLIGASPLDGFVDARLAPPGAALGRGFLGLYPVPPVQPERPERAERQAERSRRLGLGPAGCARPLLALIEALARCDADVAGIVLGPAGVLWLSGAQWLERVASARDRAAWPLAALLDVAFAPSRGGLRLRSFGMPQALGLPDVELDDALAAQDDERQRLGERVVWAACDRLAAAAAQPGAGALALAPGDLVELALGDGAAHVRVVGFTDAGEHTLRLELGSATSR
jgi:hypothetical protein